MLQYIRISLILMLFIALPAWSLDYPKTANTWKQIKTKKIPPYGIDAFSGMAYDEKAHQLLIFGGGHNDYVLNDVWAFDIKSAEWKQSYAPDPNPMNMRDCKTCFAKKYVGGYFPDGVQNIAKLRPLARHTYASIEMVKNKSGQALLFFTGNYGPGAGAPGLPFRVSGDTWLYSPQSKKWHYGSRTKGHGEGVAIYVPPGKKNGGKLYTISKDDSTNVPRVHSYDVDKDQWTHVRTKNRIRGIPHRDQTGTYVASENAIYIFSGVTSFKQNSNSLWKLDLNSLKWSQPKTSGEAPPAYVAQGLAYDYKNGVLLSISSVTHPVSVYIFDLKSRHWEKLNTTGDVPNIRKQRVIYNRFRYDKKSNLFFLVAAQTSSYTIGTWVFHYQ